MSSSARDNIAARIDECISENAGSLPQNETNCAEAAGILYRAARLYALVETGHNSGGTSSDATSAITATEAVIAARAIMAAADLEPFELCAWGGLVGGRSLGYAVSS